MDLDIQFENLQIKWECFVPVEMFSLQEHVFSGTKRGREIEVYLPRHQQPSIDTHLGPTDTGNIIILIKMKHSI